MNDGFRFTLNNQTNEKIIIRAFDVDFVIAENFFLIGECSVDTKTLS